MTINIAPLKKHISQIKKTLGELIKKYVFGLLKKIFSAKNFLILILLVIVYEVASSADVIAWGILRKKQSRYAMTKDVALLKESLSGAKELIDYANDVYFTTFATPTVKPIPEEDVIKN